MSNARKVRPLGFARQSFGSPERVKFPPLASPEQHIVGIHGNAINFPPPKMTVDRQVPSRAKSETLGDHSENIVKEKERQIREILGREGYLKKQILLLQQQVEEMKMQLVKKDDTIEVCHTKIEEITKQEINWKEKYNTEKVMHQSTKNFLKNEEQKVKDLQGTIKTQMADYEEIIEVAKQEFTAMENSKNKEIKDRDEKLKRLKTQIADALQGNSWERQQQIDELSKELKQAHEEADALRMKVKMLSNNLKDKHNVASDCQNCEDLTTKVKELERKLTRKGSHDMK